MFRLRLFGLALILTTLIGLEWNVAASAALLTCNKTAQPVRIAYAWDQGANGAYAAIVTWGWWNIAPGACESWEKFDGTEFKRDGYSYQFYATSSAGEWSGPRQLCVKLGQDFMEARFHNTERECSSGVLRGFRPMALEVKDGVLNLLPPR